MKKNKNKIITTILITMLLAFTLTSCGTEVATVYDEPAPYANLEEIDNLNSSFSGSSWGSEFGKVKVKLNWKTERFQWAEYEDCYLEYSVYENDVYERMLPISEDDRDGLAMLGNPDNLKPYGKQELSVDLDSYYDFYDVGFYRLAIVFKVKPYSGKTQEQVAYVQLMGNSIDSLDE